MVLVAGRGRPTLSQPAPAFPRFDLVSANAAGAAANGASADAAISADGRYVVFRSEATDLVPGAPSGIAAIYVRDMEGGAAATTFVGVVWAGNQVHLAHDDPPAISADGRVVAFRSVSGGTDAGEERLGIFVADRGDRDIGARWPDDLAQVDLGIGGAAPDGLSSSPALSADGRFVAFHSWASNLVAGDDNRRPDVFVHDRRTGATRLVSARADGRPARGTSVRPWIGGDGRVVVFESDASDLVPDDANGRVDVFALDMASGAIERISVSTAGREATRDSHSASVSADGRFVAFASDAGELSPSAVAGAPAVYVRDRARGVTTLVAVPFDGSAWSDDADRPAIAPDGCCVALRSASRRLVPGKTDDEPEVFVFDRRARRIDRFRPAVVDDAFSTPVELARGALAAGGRIVAMTTGRALVATDRNTVADVYALVTRGADARVWLPLSLRIPPVDAWP